MKQLLLGVVVLGVVAIVPSPPGKVWEINSQPMPRLELDNKGTTTTIRILHQDAHKVLICVEQPREPSEHYWNCVQADALFEEVDEEPQP